MIHLDTAGFLLRPNDPFLPSMTHLDDLKTPSSTSTSIMMATSPSPCPSPDTTTNINVNANDIKEKSEEQPAPVIPQKPIRAKLLLNARMLHFGKSKSRSSVFKPAKSSFTVTKISLNNFRIVPISFAQRHFTSFPICYRWTL